MFLKMTQDNYGDIMMHQEHQGIIIDTTKRLNVISKVRKSKHFKIMSEFLRLARSCARLQNLGLIRLETTSNIIIIRNVFFCIWIHFDHRDICEKVSLPCFRTFGFLKLACRRTELRTHLSRRAGQSHNRYYFR